MTTSALPPERDGLFRLVRFGVPVLLASACMALALSDSALRGWSILGGVALVAEAAPSLKRGQAYLRSRGGLLRHEGLWARGFRPLFRALGLEEAWVLSFCAWNNRRIREVFETAPARKALVLLPHCIQMAACKAPVIQDLEACYACGKCPVEDVLEASLARRWDVHLSNRSHKAYRRAMEATPDLIVAVSCTDRLLKGLLKVPEIPAFLIPLNLPHGMCVDTTFRVEHLLAAMEHLVHPKPSVKVVPLEKPGVA